MRSVWDREVGGSNPLAPTIISKFIPTLVILPPMCIAFDLRTYIPSNFMKLDKLGSQFNLYLVESFFDAETCNEIVREMRNSSSEPSTVYLSADSGDVDARVRKSERVKVSQQTVEYVRRRFLENMSAIEEHFGIELDDCEEPQFLRYRVGDFFVAHQDGNTGLLRLDREETRKVSAVIFLRRQTEIPEPDSYCGGSLVFSGRACRDFRLDGEVGNLVAFPAETTHEVPAVTHGERYSIISWYLKKVPVSQANNPQPSS